MRPRFRISAGARRHLREIAEYIRRDDPLAASRWIQKLRARARAPARSPGAGRVVAELEREDIREVLVGNDRLGYRVTATEVILIFVLEGHRQLRSLGPLDD
jgi:plasmid stabilization system protein ParE